MKLNPIFTSIMHKLKTIPPEEYDTPTAIQLFRLAHKYAPPEFNNHFIQQAQEGGHFPKPTRCNENGDALYCLEEISDLFGMTREEGRNAYNDMYADDPDALDGLHQGSVYAIQ